jgi:hypothetical protein
MAIAKKISSNMIFTPNRFCNSLLCLGPRITSAEDQPTEPQAPVPPIPLLPPAPPHDDTTRKGRARSHGPARCFTSCAGAASANACRFAVFDQMLLMVPLPLMAQKLSRILALKL